MVDIALHRRPGTRLDYPPGRAQGCHSGRTHSARAILALASVLAACLSPDLAAAQSKKTRKTIAAVISYINANDYTREVTVQVAPNLCTCAEVACDDGNDFRVNCSGAFLPLPGVQGYLTAVGTSPGSFNRCGSCGCNVSDTTATLGASIVCVGAP